MTLSPAVLRKAVRHLRASDPVLARVIDDVGACRWSVRSEGTHFDAVCRSIVYQQLAGHAAATIFGRVLDLFGGKPPTPAELVATRDARLRAAGLSRQKLAYLKDLALRVASNSLAIESLHEVPDEEVIASLVQVKGVGRWTAHMFLMFRLGRLDILPELDYGVRKAMQRAYRMRALPAPKRVTTVGAKWAPYRSVASWYLWRSLETATPPAPRARRARSTRPARTRTTRGASKR